MGDADTSVPTAPPDAGRLLALDDDLWRRVLVHLRRSLRHVQSLEPDPRLRRLTAAPTSRLVSGRARRDAAAAVGEGGALWSDLRRRVLTDPDLATTLGTALRGPSGPDDSPAAPTVDGVDPAELDRLRDRLREVRDQRDEARRRAEGETARAEREAAARHEAERARDELQARVDELQTALEAARRDRAAAVERERRRGESALAQATEELRRVRREQQDRVRRDRAADRAQEVRESRPTAPAEPAPPRLVPGRPSRLPDPVHPATTEAVDLLLHAGRLVLVDGYNVSRSHRDDLDLESQRRWLVNLLVGAAASRRIEPQVVFDGHRGDGGGSSRRDRGVLVAFTPAGISADDDLVFAVEALDPARPVVVVTDDRELRERLRPYRVDLVSTAGLLGALR